MIFRKVIPEKTLVSFPIQDLKVGVRLPFDVYIKEGGLIVHFLTKGSLFTVLARDEISKRSITEGYILEQYKDKLWDYLQKKELPYELQLERPEIFREYLNKKVKLLPIDKTLLSNDTPPTFTIFKAKKMDFIPIYQPEKDSLLPPLDDKEGDLLISCDDSDGYIDYVEGLNIKKAIQDKDIRLLLFREQIKSSLKALFDNPKQPHLIPRIIQQTNDIVSLLVENKDIFYEGLFKRISDYYSYVHSINVAILSIRLAIEIGLKISQIENLAIGAILHDIGKSAISQEIVNKQGRLSSGEYKIFRMHVTEGEKLLREYENIHEDSITAVLQHHEKLSGRGYPFRLTGSEIKLFSRIISIVDSYDAMTTNRPYRPANTTFMALSIISREKGDFDPDILRLFVRILGRA
ncbi:MAG: HD domain-containing protein [Thermodesulfovibrionales bacterium]|nr:HD domain-containing protein [Thermodesulfovibrionales bacterium]